MVKATYLRNNFFEILENCIKFGEKVSISGKKGNAVLLSEEEYRGLQAAAELCSVPKLKNKIIKGMKTSIKDCKAVDIDEL